MAFMVETFFEGKRAMVGNSNEGGSQVVETWEMQQEEGIRIVGGVGEVDRSRQRMDGRSRRK